MKWMLLIAGGGLLVLVVLSIMLPPVSIWMGGLIGIVVFLVWGNLVARLINQSRHEYKNNVRPG